MVLWNPPTPVVNKLWAKHAGGKTRRGNDCLLRPGRPAGTQKMSAHRLRTLPKLLKLLRLPQTTIHGQDRNDHRRLARLSGFDFKSSNNNVPFGGLQIFNVGPGIDRSSAGYSFSLSDAIGHSSADRTVVVSPDGMSSGNTNGLQSAAAPMRRRATPVLLEATRMTGLPQDAAWVKNLFFPMIRETGRLERDPI